MRKSPAFSMVARWREITERSCGICKRFDVALARYNEMLEYLDAHRFRQRFDEVAIDAGQCFFNRFALVHACIIVHI